MPDPSPSTLTVLSSNFLNSSEEVVVACHTGQFTPGGYLSTLKHTALAGIDALPVVLPMQLSGDKELWRYIHRVDTIPDCNGETDGQTSFDRTVRARYA